VGLRAVPNEKKTVGPGWLCHVGSKDEDRRAPNEPRATRRRVYGLCQKIGQKFERRTCE